jgi:hypothetical protein
MKETKPKKIKIGHTIIDTIKFIIKFRFKHRNSIRPGTIHASCILNHRIFLKKKTERERELAHELPCPKQRDEKNLEKQDWSKSDLVDREH